MNLPVLYGKADFNVSVEVTAEKLAENLKKTLSEIYAYDNLLFIYLCLQPNLKHGGQINLIYHTSQGNLFYVPFKKGHRSDFHSSLINQVNLIVII